MPLTNTAFVRATIGLLVLGLLILLSIVATALWLVERTDTLADDLVQWQQFRAAARNVTTTVLDGESSERGYLITREEKYLAPYQNAMERVRGEVAVLRDRAREVPEYQERVEVLADTVRQRFEAMQEVVALMDEGRTAESIAVLRTDRGKALMDSIRAISEELISDVDERLRANSLAMLASASRLTWVLIVGAVMIVIVAGGSVFLAFRYTRDLERTRGEIQALNATLEERVAERTGELARANEEVQRFAYIVSHDLRAPLVNIMGFTSELETGITAIRDYMATVAFDEEDLAAREAKLAIETELPEALGFIRSSTSKMDSLIGAILKLSREGRRVLNAERVNVETLVETAADSVRHQVAENGGEIEVQKPLPSIISDRVALEQIFGNLIDNAVKYLAKDRPGHVVVSGQETRMGVLYEIRDNGRGIAPEDRERVFELFRRAGAQDKPGEGIGLPHVRTLVRRLGGDIDFESQLGRGTTFRVRLPKILPHDRKEAA
ncbi:sensor histidine kinase [Propylenella binzhouense]|uniref:histidine kinase n=1 Tax=Propylenella binzhouense TaxID=2555902 RepID=A0A964WTH0_9HYPH|nr:CHASE3 domain-containing protein [Propylenella binzhouense]MYZ48022.1 histidine kinase [Propylenella binzhouense]